MISRYFGKRLPPADIELLVGDHGGLLFYHPASDLYSASLTNDFQYISPVDIMLKDHLKSLSDRHEHSERDGGSTLRASGVGASILASQSFAPVSIKHVGFQHEAARDNSKDVQASLALNFPLHNIWTDLKFTPRSVTSITTPISPQRRSTPSTPKAAPGPRRHKQLMSEDAVLAFEATDDADEFRLLEELVQSIRSPVNHGQQSDSPKLSKSPIKNNNPDMVCLFMYCFKFIFILICDIILMHRFHSSL